MSRVQRDSLAGRAYLDVQNLARRSGRSTEELLHLYALEGFLVRLSGAEVADRLVLKGGMLLAIWDARRPTRDIDLAGRRIPSEVDAVPDLVRSIAALPAPDGLEFDADGVTAGTIRDAAEYSGVRVTVPGRLARAVFPIPHRRQHRGPDPPTADPRGPAASPRRGAGTPARVPDRHGPRREGRDHGRTGRSQHSVARLRRRLPAHSPVPGSLAEFPEALAAVVSFRGVDLRPLAPLCETMPPLAQSRWAAWRRKQRLETALPEKFADVLGEVVRFTDMHLEL